MAGQLNCCLGCSQNLHFPTSQRAWCGMTSGSALKRGGCSCGLTTRRCLLKLILGTSFKKAIMISTTQTGKLRLGEMKCLSQSHGASPQWGLSFSTDLPDSRAGALPTASLGLLVFLALHGKHIVPHVLGHRCPPMKGIAVACL